MNRLLEAQKKLWESYKLHVTEWERKEYLRTV